MAIESDHRYYVSMQPQSIREQTIIITGASTGIGYATAKLLKSAGFNVHATVRKVEDQARLQAEGITAHRLELRDAAQCEQVIDHIAEQTGNITALINNAAYAQPGAMEDITTDQLREQFEVNVFAQHAITKAALKYMDQQDYGRVIFISSVLGFVTMPLRGAYCMTKYAIESMADSLRMEHHHDNIDFILVEPGPITSEFRNTAARMGQPLAQTNSRFMPTYKKWAAENQEKKRLPFTLPPEAVAKKILVALRVRKPKARYFVTMPTYFLNIIKRLFPVRWLDALLRKT